MFEPGQGIKELLRIVAFFFWILYLVKVVVSKSK
jgi:hypothetical protein